MRNPTSLSNAWAAFGNLVYRLRRNHLARFIALILGIVAFGMVVAFANAFPDVFMACVGVVCVPVSLYGVWLMATPPPSLRRR